MFHLNRRLVLATTLVLAGLLAALGAGIHWSMSVFLG
jgi:hypothetical protein